MIPKSRRWRFRYYTYDGTAATLAPYRTLIVTAPTKLLARLQAPRAPFGSWVTVACLGLVKSTAPIAA